MLSKTHYANGNRVYELADDTLTYFFKDGTVKATGPFRDGMMQGEWTFYREGGQLWETGSFRDNLKEGRFIRYDREDNVEYDETFAAGKKLKKQ